MSKAESTLAKERYKTMYFNGEVNISKLLPKIQETEGFLMELEVLALLHLPLLVDHLPGEIVEIGTFKGKSTTALALGSQCLTTQKRSS